MLVNEDPESQLPGYMKAATQAAIHEKRVQAMAKQELQRVHRALERNNEAEQRQTKAKPFSILASAADEAYRLKAEITETAPRRTTTSMSVPTRQGSTSDVDSILTSEPSSISCITPHESSSGGGSIRRPSFEAEIKHAMVRASRRPSFEVADPGEEALLAAAAATAAAKAAAAAVAAVDAEIAAAQEEQRLQHAAAEHAGGAPLLYSRGAAGSNVRGSRSFGNSGVRRSSLEIIIPPGDVAMEGGTLPSPLTNSRSPGAALGLMWAPEGSRPSPCSAAGATTPSPDAASASAAAGTLPGSRRGSLEKRSSFSHSRRPSMEQRHVTFGPSTAFADDSVSNQPLVPTRIPSVRSSLELQQRERELPGQAAYGCGPHSAGAAVSGVAQSASSSSFFASAAVPQRRVTIDAEDDLSSMVSASAPSGTAASASTSSETPSPIIAWKAAAPPAAAAAAAAAALGVGSGSSRGLVHSASDTSRRHSFGLEPHPPAAAPAHRPLSHHLHGAEPAAATGLPPRNGERIVLNSDTSLGAGDPGQAAMIRCASPVGLASKPISAAASTHHHQHHAPGKAASCMASFGRTLVQRHVVEGVVAEEGEELAAASRSASPSPAPQAQRKGLSTLNLPSRFSMLTKSRSPSGSGNSLSAGADSDLVVQVSGGSCPVMQYGGAAAKPPAIFAVPRGGMAHHAASVAAAETDAAHLRSMLGRN